MSFWYSLVELLPFSWAAEGGMYFMKNALLAIIVITPLFGILSTMVVGSKKSFFSDAMGHSAFTGIAIGAICGMAQPMWCAVALAVVFSLLYSFVRHRSSISSDTVIGVFSSIAIALGIFIATAGGRSFTKYNVYLIGDILSVSPGEIGLLAIVLAVVVILWVLFFNKFMLSSAHPSLAQSRGISVFWQEALFSAVIAVVVTLAMTWVGLLVINSMLILPAAAARNISRNMRKYHLFSILGALACGIAGLMTSFYMGASSGAAISLYLGVYFIICFIIGSKNRKLK